LFSVLDFSIITLTSLSVFFDVTVRRIPNWLILCGLAAGILVNALQGLSQLTQSLLGLFLGITVFLVPFAFRWLGAGDVKYFGVVGALLGVQWLPRVLFYSIIAAGVIALGYVIVARLDLNFLKRAWTDCKLAVLTLGQVLPDPADVNTVKGTHSVPWGVAIGTGTLVAYYVDPEGRWAGF